jgi:hypothetical protein
MSFDPITAALDIGGKLIDKLFPDPAQRDKAKLDLLALQQNGELAVMTGQMDINKEEAKSTSWFVAGWRPYIGWVCGTGLGYQFLFMPIGNGLVLALNNVTPFVSLDTSTLITCLFGMLGIGGMRTYEKVNGSERNR